MESFSSARREMLKFGGIGLATSIATLPAFAAEKRSSEIAITPHLFDIRTYGAVGDGKTVDTPAINKATKLQPPRAVARFSSRWTCASS